MKKLVMLMMTLGLVAMLAACGGDDSGDNGENDGNGENNTEESQDGQDSGNSDGQASGGQVEVTDEEKVDEGKVVANVNGTKVKGKKYNTMYKQNKVMMSQYGQDTSNTEQVKSQTLDGIIQQELVKQDASEKGITVTDEEVQTRFDETKSNAEGNFTDQLKQNNYTEETYKEALKESLLIEKYMDQEISVSEVTDEEVQQYYDQLKEQQGESSNLPKLEEMKGQIKSQLQQQKQSQQLQSRVQKLQEDADVEKMI